MLTGLLFIVTFTFVGLFWANYRFSLRSSSENSFVPRWAGTRLFLTNGLNPYGDQATRQIQNYVYGATAHSSENQALFLYPFYAFIVFTPFALIKNLVVAQAIWMTVLDLALLATIVISIYLSNWRISKWMWALLLFFLTFWIHTVHPMIQGDPSVLVALFIAIAFLAIRFEHDVLAGVLLVLASIKPQVVFILILFVLIWAATNGRWALFWSFLGGISLLVIATLLLLPDGWLLQDLRQIATYLGSSEGGSPGAIFVHWVPGIGRQMGWVLTVFMAGILFWEWRAVFNNDFNWFYWTACLTLVITTLIGVHTSTINFIVLIPALVLVLAIWNERWGRLGRWLVVLSMISLFLVLWAFAFVGARHGIPFDLNPFLFLPLPFFLLIGLYWVRWWAIRPPRLPLDELSVTVG